MFRRDKVRFDRCGTDSFPLSLTYHASLAYNQIGEAGGRHIASNLRGHPRLKYLK